MFKIIKKRTRQGLSFIKRDEPALLTFLFHSIFENIEAIEKKHIAPQQQITVDIYKEFIEYFLNAGYKFISPNDLDSLDSSGKYILSTFDDGYFNNSLVVPILQEYKSPAVFFISTNNVINNECFWWDVAFRELSKKNLSKKELSRELKKYKNLKHNEIVSSLKEKYGNNVFQPLSDIDRPFSIDELKSFAKEEFVHIGNHTKDHYILDNYSYDEQFANIAENNNDLEKILNIKPNIIAYPNGNYNKDTISAAEKLDFKYGITVKKHKNYLPLKSDINSKLTLGRYVLWGNENLKMQFDTFRSDL